MTKYNKSILKLGEKVLSGKDLSFFQRVWKTDSEIYKNRLASIGFQSKNRVLDAGCGFGQWSVELAKNNNEVFSLDVCNKRVELLNKIKKKIGISNIFESIGSIEKLCFEDEYFDSIFCYSSIYFSDVSKSLKEFYRVLKPKGIIYISTNDFGWYIHNLIDGHNSDINFNSKRMAINSLHNSLEYYSNGRKLEGQIVVPKLFLKNKMKEIGFKKIRIGPDGTIGLIKLNKKVKIFYPESYNFGKSYTGVYEVLSEK